MKSNTYLKLDSRNRVTLSKISKKLSPIYRAYQKGEQIILEPIKEIPKEEEWIFDPKNKAILDTLKEAIKEKGVNDWQALKKHLKL